MRIDLRDRVLVITGASSGIGRATALEAACAGMDVVVSARRTDKLEEVAAEIRGRGRRALVVKCDVNVDAEVTALVQAALRELGRLDVFFANAGYGLYRAAAQMTEAELRDIFETNFFGTVRCVRAVLPVLRQRGDARYRGQVVICSSAASEVGIPMYAGYAATKAAQDGYASALRSEMYDEGIYVTTVHPVPTTTEFFTAMQARADNPALVQHSPSPVTQSVEHVARCIVRAMRRPRRAEVWPHLPSRLGAGLATAFPVLPAWALRRQMHQLRAIDPSLRL